MQVEPRTFVCLLLDFWHYLTLLLLLVVVHCSFSSRLVSLLRWRGLWEFLQCVYCIFVDDVQDSCALFFFLFFSCPAVNQLFSPKLVSSLNLHCFVFFSPLSFWLTRSCDAAHSASSQCASVTWLIGMHWHTSSRLHRACPLFPPTMHFLLKMCSCSCAQDRRRLLRIDTSVLMLAGKKDKSG